MTFLVLICDCNVRSEGISFVAAIASECAGPILTRQWICPRTCNRRITISVSTEPRTKKLVRTTHLLLSASQRRLSKPRATLSTPQRRYFLMHQQLATRRHTDGEKKKKKKRDRNIPIRFSKRFSNPLPLLILHPPKPINTSTGLTGQ